MDSQSSTALPMEPPAIPGEGEEDLISGLPDELLHTILIRLPSAAAAARTSVLSRRWRGVWAHMPELVLGGSSASATTPSALLDSIDAALNSSAAPTLRSLKIEVSGFDRRDVPMHRISPWLRFASQRIAGKLSLLLDLTDYARTYGDTKEELALPICERATEIDLDMVICNVFLRLPPTGSFSLLTDLKISCGEVDSGELGRVVSSQQCPRLRILHLFVLKLKPVRDISISSKSLRCFDLSSPTGKLELTAPLLQEISVHDAPDEACIVVAPKLEKVAWLDTYDPCRHQFVLAGRYLRSLSILHLVPSSTRLMERFDTTSELTVYLSLMKWHGIEGYMTFMKEMEKLPICESLVVDLITDHYVFAPMVLHLLRGCSCIRKFRLILFHTTELPSCTTSDCPCCLPENYKLDDITFNSLEEIEIEFFTGSVEQVGFVELLLSRCSTVILKRVVFTVPYAPVSPDSEIMEEVVQRIRSMCHPNGKVQFNLNFREVDPKI